MTIESDKLLKKPRKGPRYPGSAWGPVTPMKIPDAKKPTSSIPEPPVIPDGDPRGRPTKKGKSAEKVQSLRKVDAGFELTAEGQMAYENLVASVPKVDLSRLASVEERMPGDRAKLVRFFEALALGARHREALGDLDWVWSNFSMYRFRFPVINEMYVAVKRLGEETREILRMDEAHRRAHDGVEEDMYSASGKYCGTRIKYSDALLTLFLKADNPDKFSDKLEVKNTGVVLQMHMGLRENVRQEAMTQGDIVVESPFADDKGEELPGGV